jgi:hypothetical protein
MDDAKQLWNEINPFVDKKVKDLKRVLKSAKVILTNLLTHLLTSFDNLSISFNYQESGFASFNHMELTELPPKVFTIAKLTNLSAVGNFIKKASPLNRPLSIAAAAAAAFPLPLPS